MRTENIKNTIHHFASRPGPQLLAAAILLGGVALGGTAKAGASTTCASDLLTGPICYEAKPPAIAHSKAKVASASDSKGDCDPLTGVCTPIGEQPVARARPAQSTIARGCDYIVECDPLAGGCTKVQARTQLAQDVPRRKRLRSLATIPHRAPAALHSLSPSGSC